MKSSILFVCKTQYHTTYTFLLACLPFVAIIIVLALFTVPLLWGPVLGISVLAHVVQYFKPDKKSDTEK